MAENEKRPPGLFFVDHALDLRPDLRLPGRDVVRLLTLLVLHVRKPDAAEVWRLSERAGNREGPGQHRGQSGEREGLHVGAYARKPCRKYAGTVSETLRHLKPPAASTRGWSMTSRGGG